MTDQPEAQDDDQTSLVRALFGHPEGDTPPATDHTPPDTATPAADELDAGVVETREFVRALLGPGGAA